MTLGPRADQDGSFAAMLGVPASFKWSLGSQWLEIARQVWWTQHGSEMSSLEGDLVALLDWFNPNRTGKRLRAQLANLRATPGSPPSLGEEPDRLFMQVGEGRFLITPEGRVLAEVIRECLGRGQTEWCVLDETDLARGVGMLLSTYRGLTRQRLEDVLALLTGASKQTLRPAAAGLLLVLLINRNTAEERPLRKFLDDRSVANRVTTALAEPAAAYARAFAGGESDSVDAVNVYRGWAYGELARRLGPTFKDSDDQLYLSDPSRAEARLIEDIESRPADQRARIPVALDAALNAYHSVRPFLSAAAIAFDRPANTKALFARLKEAAKLETTQEANP